MIIMIIHRLKMESFYIKTVSSWVAGRFKELPDQLTNEHAITRQMYKEIKIDDSKIVKVLGSAFKLNKTPSEVVDTSYVCLVRLYLLCLSKVKVL